MDVPRHNADFAGIWRDDTGTVWPDKAALGVFKRAFDWDHVEHRDAFGDTNDHFYLGVDCLKDAVSRKWGRDIDHRGIGASHMSGLMHGIENGQIKMRLTAFARGHTADHFGAICDCLFSV